MDLQLYGRKALVTGSSKGIGEAIARKLALEKATVIVHGRDKAQVEKIANEITAQGGHAYAVVGDLTQDDDVHRLIQDAEKLAGTIDILVNNAGGSGGSKESWANTQPASWASAYDRNVLGCASCHYAAVA
jgi:3-oxoacyl-[acyl-carrier protein] reductase